MNTKWRNNIQYNADLKKFLSIPTYSIYQRRSSIPLPSTSRSAITAPSVASLSSVPAPSRSFNPIAASLRSRVQRPLNQETCQVNNQQPILVFVIPPWCIFLTWAIFNHLLHLISVYLFNFLLNDVLFDTHVCFIWPHLTLKSCIKSCRCLDLCALIPISCTNHVWMNLIEQITLYIREMWFDF